MTPQLTGVSTPGVRRVALLAGVAASICFIAVSTLDAFAHPAYSALAEPISNLGAIGPDSWLQNANFLVTGLLMLLFAGGFYGALRGVIRAGWLRAATFFLAVTGSGLAIVSGFATDVPGFPAVTLHGLLHDILFFTIFGALFTGLQVAGWQLRRVPGRQGFGWYTIVSSVVMLALFVLLAAMRQGQLAGLYQRIFVFEHAFRSFFGG